MEISVAWLLLPLGLFILGAVVLSRKMADDLRYCITQTMINLERKHQQLEAIRRNK